MHFFNYYYLFIPLFIYLFISQEVIGGEKPTENSLWLTLLGISVKIWEYFLGDIKNSISLIQRGLMLWEVFCLTHFLIELASDCSSCKLFRYKWKQNIIIIYIHFLKTLNVAYRRFKFHLMILVTIDCTVASLLLVKHRWAVLQTIVTEGNIPLNSLGTKSKTKQLWKENNWTEKGSRVGAWGATQL